VVRDLPLRLVTAIATSIAIVTVTTHAMVLFGWWQPARMQLVLAAGSAVLFVRQLSRARARPLAAGAMGVVGVEVQASR
jgi:CHASE2 domain-containing sensor protein